MTTIAPPQPAAPASADHALRELRRALDAQAAALEADARRMHEALERYLRVTSR